MKKKNNFIISISILLLLIFGLSFFIFEDTTNESVTYLTESMPLQRMEILNPVAMSVSESHIPLEQNKIIVTIQNPTDYFLSSGVAFELEFLEEDGWRNIPMLPNQGFTEIGYPIQPGEFVSFQKDLSLYPLNEVGVYRIRKSIFIEGSAEPIHELVAEFERE